MPFYEYECASCRFYVEVMQKISEAPLKKCPSCGKPALKKLVSAPVFRLKGSGWYETDFKSDKEAKRNLVADSDKEPVSDTMPKVESKPSETKAAAAPSKPAAKPVRTAAAAKRASAATKRKPAAKSKSKRR